VRGKLALAKGYTLLTGLMSNPAPNSEAARTRMAALDQFVQASLGMPRSPDPHLALARIYVYSLPDSDKALAEFRRAEALGYRLQPREIEQEGDAFRLRAEREFAAGSREDARRDAGRARRFYSHIRGFDLADQHLRSLDRMNAVRPSRRRRRSTLRWE
jgi:hypothetical protein